MTNICIFSLHCAVSRCLGRWNSANFLMYSPWKLTLWIHRKERCLRQNLGRNPGRRKRKNANIVVPRYNNVIREIKFDVTWSCVKQQTAKMTSEFVFFSSNPSLNHLKIGKCLLLFATIANIFTLQFRELKTDGKSFIFAVCGLTYDHVTANLK